MGTARALVAESGVCLENDLVVAIPLLYCLIAFSRLFLLLNLRYIAEKAQT